MTRYAITLLRARRETAKFVSNKCYEVKYGGGCLTSYYGEMNPDLSMEERIRKLKIYTRVCNIQSFAYKTFIFPCNLNHSHWTFSVTKPQ